jgi:hypothetical protein
MLREKMLLLIKKSIEEQIKLNDYSLIYYKVKIADNYTQGGVCNVIDDSPNLNYLISYMDSLEFFRIYNEALLTSDRFNSIEIQFDQNLNTNAKFNWDQAFYDADLHGNKKVKKKK